ncbi:hypothetical protein KDU71_02505 [Carboxylicivirga sediminis]|uniref:Transglutaminase domain-containing protein n=1 Tax=Carboxylicivirga sediminis TaxID=2006564 RepID=A0A941EZW1_9BACT|nr:hypothetical protein [Carboxylicivirga sediminis]MBR8534416.1 hypothetical protein [Carboxylicivirga sediminis]
MNPIKYLNGLGVVASGKRTLKDGSRYDKYFALPKMDYKYLTYSGSTNDTIGFMADIIKNTLADTKAIAPVLKGRDLGTTLSNIFSFVFDHIQYKPDDPQNEELRRPIRAWADRQSGVDCDCYSILIGSILSNLNIPFALRMVKIGGKPYFQHVYVVVPKNGKRTGLSRDYYTVDPVLDTFNEEHPFTGKYDLFMQPIKYLNGVPSASLNGLQGNAIDNLYYSEEAAETPETNVIFFDGIDYYDRVNVPGMNGLNGLQGLGDLGFLRKIWGAVKTVGKSIKKIGKKAVKRIVHKKDGSKRGIFKLFSKKDRNQEAMSPMASQGLSPVSVSAPKSLTPIGTPAGSDASVSPKDMIDIAKNMDNSMGVDSILNLTRSLLPDNTMVAQLIDAKAQASAAANKGVSPLETRLMATDAAKAQTAEAKVMAAENKADMLETMYNMNQKQAGFSLNNPMSMLMVGGLLLGGMMLIKSKSA